MEKPITGLWAQERMLDQGQPVDLEPYMCDFDHMILALYLAASPSAPYASIIIACERIGRHARDHRYE